MDNTNIFKKDAKLSEDVAIDTFTKKEITGNSPNWALFFYAGRKALTKKAGEKENAQLPGEQLLTEILFAGRYKVFLLRGDGWRGTLVLSDRGWG
jgi:hypothetical protein